MGNAASSPYINGKAIFGLLGKAAGFHNTRGGVGWTNVS